MAEVQQLNFTIHGEVDAHSFPSWIRNYSAKLDIEVDRIDHQGNTLLVEASGIPEMLETLTIVCLLGPSDVMVEDVRVREPAA